MKKIIQHKYQLFFVAFVILLTSCGNKDDKTDLSETKVDAAAVALNTTPEVNVMEIKNENIGSVIQLTGRLKALRAVNIVSEVQGKMLQQQKELDVGVAFKKGETLAKIERTQTDLNLYAMRAKFNTQIINLLSDLELDNEAVYPKWKTYTDNFNHKQLLPELPKFTDEREKYLFNLRNIPGQYLDIKAQEERLTKYEITAPFSGIITQSSVDYGDIVSPGKPIAKLLGTGVYEYEAAVNEQDLAYLKIGSSVKLTNANTGKTYNGRILRTGGIVDENTQTIPIYIAVTGAGLKQGTYLEGSINGKSFSEVAAIPNNVITRNNEVYVVKGDAVELLPIQRVGSIAGKSLVKGIPNGSLVINQTVSTATLRGKIKPVQSNSGKVVISD